MLFAFFKQFRRPRCLRFQQLISPYLDSELDQAEVTSLESHLADCDECRKRSEKMRFASRLVANLPLHEMEPARDELFH